MNYSKKSIRTKRKKLSAKGTMLKNKISFLILKGTLILTAACIAIGSCAMFGVYKGILASAPSIDNIDATPSGYKSVIYDSEGNVIETLVASGGNRIYVTIDQIPLHLQHAFVAIEDERFYEHNGVDLMGIARAGITGIVSGGFSQGASTITQQLLKNNVFTNWVNEENFSQKLKRKIQEQYLAIELEKKVSKDWILENYLNSINLGQNTLGVQAAALRYFDKNVYELTLSECAVIAAITQNPSAYNPIRYPENNQKRMQKVLRRMLEQEYISQEEYDEAIADDVYSRIQSVNSNVSASNSTSSYFVDALLQQVVEDLIELKGYTETQAYKAVYSGGLQIYSTQDSRIQNICETEMAADKNYTHHKVYINWYIKYQNPDGEVSARTEQNVLAYMKKFYGEASTLNFSSQEAADKMIEEYKNYVLAELGGSFVTGSESVLYIPQPQASVTIMDQYTGYVVALVGGRGEKTGSLTLNRATGTYRQPGSTFKILSTYAPALESGKYTLASVQDDAPYNKTDGTPLRNHDDSFQGFTSYREAIIDSINIVAVKALEDITPSVGYDYLLNFGFTSLSNQDIVQVLCLGGITNGVSNLELTAAYAAIANGGTYIKPTFYTKILDHNGNVLIEKTPERHTVLKETTAWLLTSAMQDVMTEGTGVNSNFPGMATAGKTGTTSSNRDAWNAGYTPYYTCTIWGGYDDNSKMDDYGYVRRFWADIMWQVHRELPYKDFVMPYGITSAEVCSESGLLAIDGVCNHDPRGSAVITEYFTIGTVPTEYCNHHIAVNVCTDSGKHASANCPESHVESVVYVIGASQETDDTPYLLPEDFEEDICPIHSSDKQNSNQDNATVPGTDH